jgi:hypothetical protein
MDEERRRRFEWEDGDMTPLNIVMSERLSEACSRCNIHEVHNLATGGETDLDVDGTVERGMGLSIRRRMTAPSEGRRLWKMLRHTVSIANEPLAITETVVSWARSLGMYKL